METYIAVLKKYAVFDGRASRREYWMFALVNALISFAIGLVLGILAAGTHIREIEALSYIYTLAVLLPSLGVGVRRLHDIGKSGWWLLLLLIPIIGVIVIIIFLVKKSEPGDNKYGPNPYGTPAAMPSAPVPPAAA